MTNDDFDKIWNTVVLSEFAEYEKKFPGLFLYSNSKRDVFEEYSRQNNYCKHYYMKDPTKPLDRHKVSSAIIIAILKVEPIRMSSELYIEDKEHLWLFNQKLAITVGLSVLVSFIEYDNEENEELLNKTRNGIIYPEANHGTYINNFATELYYTHKDGNYNLLALANELFLLECWTLK